MRWHMKKSPLNVPNNSVSEQLALRFFHIDNAFRATFCFTSVHISEYVLLILNYWYHNIKQHIRPYKDSTLKVIFDFLFTIF